MSYPNLQPLAALLVALLLLVRYRSAFRLEGFRDALSLRLRELERRVVVALIRGVREASRFGVLGAELSLLLNELKRRLPVYSAETIEGKEAEFIRDELPARFPSVLVVVALLVLGAVVWWFSH
jgi:hypothetical protein